MLRRFLKQPSRKTIIDYVTYHGSFLCDCGERLTFSVTNDGSVCYPQCDRCCIEYRVSKSLIEPGISITYNSGRCDICKKHCTYIEYERSEAQTTICCYHSEDPTRSSPNSDAICVLCQNRSDPWEGIQLMNQIFVTEITSLIYDLRSREWCKLPYPGHPKGCPNYGQRETCPPQAPLLPEKYDLGKLSWLIAIRFDLQAQEEKKKQAHPNWTKKQCRNSRYWQGRVRKQLREFCEVFIKTHPGTGFELIPEAMGMHVIRTAKINKIPIKTRPTQFVFKIAFVGYLKTKMRVKKTLMNFLSVPKVEREFIVISEG